MVSVSPVEFLILLHLRSRELRRGEDDIGQYGYEMLGELTQLFAGNWEAKSGTIYPILSKMNSANDRPALLASESKKSPLGPVKKVYVLTPAGRQVVDSLVLEYFSTDLSFIVQYIDLLSPMITRLQTEEVGDNIYMKLIDFPVQLSNLALRRAVHSQDQTIKRHKLTYLKSAMDLVLANIEKQLEDLDASSE